MTGCCCLPSAPASSSGPVTLNVGGRHFTTSRSTIGRCPKLLELVSGRPGADGTYFLDRDGQYFNEVLNFLRDGPELFTVPMDVDLRRGLQREALFFDLQQLVGLVKEAYVGADLPDNERVRLERLDGLEIMHTEEHEHKYDSITRIIAALLDVPIALISLVHEDHQWFKSRCGLEACSTSRQSSFCAFTFKPEKAQLASMFVVECAKNDPRFKDNPLVTGPPYIAFYAGCPLVTSDGIRLGALCAIDKVPRSISSMQAQMIVSFAQLAVQEIERLQLLTCDEEGSMDELEDMGTTGSEVDFTGGVMRQDRMREALDEAVCLVRVQQTTTDWPILFASRAFMEMTDITITPPERLPGFATASGGGLKNIAKRPGRKDLGFFDWMELVGKSHEDLRQEVRLAWNQQEPTAFALKGKAPVMDDGVPIHRTVACRFTPGCLPIDAAAAVVLPVPQRRAEDKFEPMRGMPGRLYFVSVVRSREVCGALKEYRPNFADGLAASAPSEMLQLSSSVETPQRYVSESEIDAPKQRKRRGNTVDAIASMKPARSPFDEVRLVRMVGQGSFGKVCYGLWLGAPVAVKIIESQSSEQQQKFEPAFECVLSASMSHPNLVQTFMTSSRTKPAANSTTECDQTVETWMVQEWCDRGTLGSLCSRPRLDAAEVSEVIDMQLDICGAGSYLHSRGIIHGDLTANNVLIKTQISRKGYVCKICDFGLARVLEGGTTDIMTTQLGTVTHMPPELFALGREVKLTTMADIYAAGILLWQMVKGESPFAGLSPPQVVVQIVKGRHLRLPEGACQEIVEIYDQCTAVDPDKRPTFDTLVRFYAAFQAQLTNQA